MIKLWITCFLPNSFDPKQFIQPDVLQIYELSIGRYILKQDQELRQIGLQLKLWEGVYEGMQAQWLRWADMDGKLLPTGSEHAEQERARADRLAAQLRALGVEPEI